MKFTLQITLNGVGMDGNADIADALERVARTLWHNTNRDSGVITDRKGEICGHWAFTEHKEQPR